MPPSSTRPRKSYRAPDAERRSVRLCQDIPHRSKGKRTGAVKLAAYGYGHLGALFGMTDKEIRIAVAQGKINFALLASVIAFAAADRKRLAHIKRLAKNARQLSLISTAPRTRGRR